MSKNNDNLISPLIDAIWDVGVLTCKSGSTLVCKCLGIKSSEQIQQEKDLIEEQMRLREQEESRLREIEIENRNTLILCDRKLNFNELFINCGLKNKLKDMPILEKVDNHKEVDIYSFKLPIGVTVSRVQERIEDIADFFEVPQMNIKLQKKNGLMDIIITKDNIFNRTFEYNNLNLSKGLKVPVGHFINKDYMEKMLVVDMGKDEIPHAFIGSSTGGGKSNFIRVMLLSWIMNNTPKDLELYLIDGKGGTDYVAFLQSPHIFMNRCFSSADEIISILSDAIQEILRRNQIFINISANNYQEYTQLGNSLPRRVIIFDEYAMYHGSKEYPEMQSKVGKICSMGRSAGVHIIVATQDGRREILDSMIKYNMPLKIGFKCDNAQHSINISGNMGLETINRIGVGRIYGLPIDTEYIQFKSMKSPSSSDIRKMIKNKYGDIKVKVQDNINSPVDIVLFGEECEE